MSLVGWIANPPPCPAPRLASGQSSAALGSLLVVGPPSRGGTRLAARSRFRPNSMRPVLRLRRTRGFAQEAITKILSPRQVCLGCSAIYQSRARSSPSRCRPLPSAVTTTSSVPVNSWTAAPILRPATLLLAGFQCSPERESMLGHAVLHEQDEGLAATARPRSQGVDTRWTRGPGTLHRRGHSGTIGRVGRSRCPPTNRVPADTPCEQAAMSLGCQQSRRTQTATHCDWRHDFREGPAHEVLELFFRAGTHRPRPAWSVGPADRRVRVTLPWIFKAGRSCRLTSTSVSWPM